MEFQGQILKQSYLRNRRANWQWTIVGHSWPDDRDRDLFVTKIRCKELPQGVRAFWILEVQFGSCGYIGILLVSK